MELIMMGLSFKTADMTLLEKASYNMDKDISEGLRFLKNQVGVSECVIVATCNRNEAYCYASSYLDGLNGLKALFVDFIGVGTDDVERYFYIKAGEDTINHIINVACGLDSMVIGEDQILGQVNDARQQALAVGACGKVMDRLFREAVTAGKAMRTSTGISHIPTSISYMAVKHAAKMLGGLNDKTAFVIGTGQMGKLAIRYLLEEGARVYITNRTVQKAMDMAAAMPGVQAVEYPKKYQYIASSDLLISATNAPHYVVYKERLEEFIKPGKRLLALDLSVPRDIDPSIDDIAEINLLDMDRFKAMMHDNDDLRRRLLSEAVPIMEAATDRFIKWYNALEAVPIINMIDEWADALCDEEIQKIMHKLSTDRDREIAARVMKRLTGRLMSRPIGWVKQCGENGSIDQYRRIITDMFGMEDSIE
jgi:glutamyl-tRNA reductase